MSATRDKTQKTVFVYSNLYQLYRRGLQQSKASPSVTEPPGGTASSAFEVPSSSSRVLKSDDLHARLPRVEPYHPPELLRKRFRGEPELLAAVPSGSLSPVAADGAIESLRSNLRALNDLHARLRFMLRELEECVSQASSQASSGPSSKTR